VTVFVDTSALYALLDADDQCRNRAIEAMEGLQSDGTTLLTHSYVLVESIALVQRRVGTDAAIALNDDLLPLMTVEWVDADLHKSAWIALRSARRRQVSLVDHVSFELMRRRGIRIAFAFDDDFEREGFDLL
jgi:predicted nucleic acid-binding protein